MAIYSNWRALPKRAGLLRCEKSCRLPWINYLRPDIKRGNCSKEEEETMIKLHGMLGNRWQAIASRLPGRTDNEIKNVWHTHLKKRLGHDDESKPQQCIIRLPNCHVNDTKLSESANPTIPTHSGSESIGYAQMFPQSSSSDHSSVTNTSITTTETNSASMIKIEYKDPFEIYPVIDENSWSEPQVVENSSVPSNYLDDLQFPFPSADTVEPLGSYGYAPDTDDDLKFWHNFFVKSQGIE